MNQLDLFNQRFDGSDIVPERDNNRLGKQILDIYNLMKDGKERTLNEIHKLTGHPEASISAQLRNLRKSRFGSHDIQKKYIHNGLYTYKLVEK